MGASKAIGFMEMNASSSILTKIVSTPCGELELASYDGAIIMCDWTIQPRHDRIRKRIENDYGIGMIPGDDPSLDEAARQIEEYFKGQRKEFTLALEFCGTPMQCQIWQLLVDIAYGTVTTYSYMAKAIGRPQSVRPVANAIGANPISLIIPCHRVVGSDGSLSGYAGGIETKKYLLDLEEKFR